jgi:putative SbcD/Mre11-related phosphoesterase
MDPTFRDRALYVPGEDALVLADLHLGRDETSNVELRLGEHEDIVDRFGALVDEFAPREVVFGGDLLHSFGSLPRGVMETVSELRAILDDADANAVVTPGNHDSMLEQVWKGPTEDEHRLGDGLVLHGHEPPDATAEWYVVGHDHPTISIEGQRRPCYLWGEGTYRGADVLMLPSFTRLAAGVEVNGMRAADFQSPLVRNADAFRPVVRDEDADETLRFPPLGQFRRLL